MPEWWIGRKHSEETKRKMREAKLGARNSFYGKAFTPEMKARLSAARKGQHAGAKNPNFGKPRSEEVKAKIRASRLASGVARGARNPNWRGGVSRGRTEMATTAYKEWRRAVFERDQFTCRACGKRGGDLEADHIKPWAFFPEDRYKVDNGRTLCRPCHVTTFKEIRKWRQEQAG